MMYFYRVVYFLVILWIQGGGTQLISISANPTTVSQGGEFAITCQTAYSHFGFKRNNNWIIQTSYGKCDIPTPDTQKYKCELKRNGIEYIIKLKVLRGESSPQIVQWSCVHSTDNRTHSDVVNITVRNPESTNYGENSSSKRQSNKKPSTGRPQTPSSKNTKTINKQLSSNSSPGQPPVSGTNNINNQPKDFNITLIAICGAVVVLVLLITLVAVMFLLNKRKEGQPKPGPSRPLAQEPVGFSDEGNYDDIENLPPPKYDWTVGDEDFVGLNETSQDGDVPASSNPNFDASNVYGVVRKKDPTGASKAPYGEAEAVSRNPNFDPDKVYGVVDKSATSQYPVFGSKTDNVYTNQ